MAKPGGRRAEGEGRKSTTTTAWGKGRGSKRGHHSLGLQAVFMPPEQPPTKGLNHAAKSHNTRQSQANPRVKIGEAGGPTRHIVLQLVRLDGQGQQLVGRLLSAHLPGVVRGGLAGAGGRDCRWELARWKWVQQRRCGGRQGSTAAAGHAERERINRRLVQALALGWMASHSPSLPMSRRPPEAGSVTWHTWGGGRRAWEPYQTQFLMQPFPTPPSHECALMQQDTLAAHDWVCNTATPRLTSGSAATAGPASASPIVRAMLRPPGHTLQPDRGRQQVAVSPGSAHIPLSSCPLQRQPPAARRCPGAGCTLGRWGPSRT